MAEEKKAAKILTEEQARNYLQKVKKGDLHTLTDRIWVHYPKASKQQKQD